MSRSTVIKNLGAPLAHSIRSRPSLFQRCYATSDRTSDKVPTNDPKPPEAAQNVSETNETPVSAMGLRDKPFREMTQDSERQRTMQAPNRSEPWSRSQMPRERGMSGPRFEQTIMEYQVREHRCHFENLLVKYRVFANHRAIQPQPQAAIELIHKQPVRWTKQRVVSCDGGGGVLGHPRIFINVDKPQINWPMSITDSTCRVYQRLLTRLSRREPLERYPNLKESQMNHLGKDDL
ncbi:MAG: hypothetical protein Q9177_000344 [Variospora cf. flavescens]